MQTDNQLKINKLTKTKSKKIKKNQKNLCLLKIYWYFCRVNFN